MLNPLPPSVTVSTPGTCGELVQGWHPGWQQPVLVSCPIDRSGRVTASLSDDPAIRVTGSERHAYDKARRAARLALDALGARGVGVRLHIDSDLPSGRGFAASTADVVGALAAVGQLLGQPFSPAALAELACRIEPSDSTMFATATALAYRDSGRCETIGPAPALPLLLLDGGEMVDTLAFNRRLKLATLRQLGPSTATALALLRRGLAGGDWAAVGAAASLSADSYQAIRFSRLVAQAQRWAADTRALGLVRAHSGSIVGLLYPPGAPLDELADRLRGCFGGAISATRLAPGGCLVTRPEAVLVG